MNEQRRFKVMMLWALSVGAAGLCAYLLAGFPASAQPPSAAAIAKLPGNRGKVVGAPCEYRDGYVANFDRLHAKAGLAQGVAGKPQAPVNLMAFADKDTPPPLQTYELPPGRAYCLKGLDSPEGYLTMNCKTSADCPAPASCQGAVCRAACSQDSDCAVGSICTKPDRPGAGRYCRCEDCVTRRSP